MTKEMHIVIAGGGPAGLFVAGRLLQLGFSCTVLEKKKVPDPHSRSLGIHPVSLELFYSAGIADPFLEQGIKIRKGIAFWNRDKIGEISFQQCPGKFNYVLSLPQWETEKILEEWVHSLNPETIIRGAEVTNLDQDPASVCLYYLHNNREKKIKADFVVGCDGKNSTVRRLLNIPFMGNPYPDTYVMGDFSDSTPFGNDAAVYLNRDGLIESFPLPGRMRRWVAKTDSFVAAPESEYLHHVIEERTGHSLTSSTNTMMSSFGVQHFLADSYYSGRVLLVGDSAHVVSPIGGQGMNLGWLDAEACVHTISKAAEQIPDIPRLFMEYSNHQKKIARQVARRAEINMWLGRKENSGPMIQLSARLITKKPISNLLARVFTMRGLGSWWF